MRTTCDSLKNESRKEIFTYGVCFVLFHLLKHQAYCLDFYFMQVPEVSETQFTGFTQ